jgi:hypothetical protein
MNASLSKAGIHLFAVTPSEGNANGVKSFSPGLAALGLPRVIVAKISYAESIASPKVHDALPAALHIP